MSIAAPTVTGYQPFWSLQAPAGQGAAYAPLYHRSSQERRAAIALSRPGFRQTREILRTLVGAAPGDTALDQYTRRQAVPGIADSGLTTPQGGGVATMETVTTVNAATTAAQATYINALIVDQGFIMDPAIASYPADASGNGGGGKVNF